MEQHLEGKPFAQHQFLLFAVEYLRQHVASNLVGIDVTLFRRDGPGGLGCGPCQNGGYKGKQISAVRKSELYKHHVLHNYR